MTTNPDYKYFTCEQCPSSDFVRGPVDFPSYVCERCPGEGQTYQIWESDAPYTCQCDEEEGYIAAGDICLPEDIEDEIPQPNAERVEYEAVLTGGREDQEYAITTSDTFSYLYLKAAYLCSKHKDP